MWGMTEHIIFGAIFLAGAALFAWDRWRKRVIELDKPFPEWIADKYNAVLIDPTMSIWVTHVFNRTPRYIPYKGVNYRVTGYAKLRDSRAQTTEGPTDITIALHEPVEGVTPVSIVPEDYPVKGRAMAYLRKQRKTISGFLSRRGPTTLHITSGASFGDSGSPVVTEDGRLIFLIQEGGGFGANIPAILDVIYDFQPLED